MAVYTGYTAAEYAPDAPATSDHFKRWFENWEAGFQGAAGAPALLDAALDTTATNVGRDWVLNRTALASAGAVGTYGYFRCTNTASVGFGSTVAGSTLTPVGHQDPNKNITDVGTARSGTWRCMGYNAYSPISSAGDVADYGVTLWLRIS